MPGQAQIPVFPPWAVEANYPAGSNPWNGQPTKLPPLADYFIPSTPQNKVPPPAQWFNYLFNAASATAWYANGAAQSVAALNWQAWTSVNVFSAWTHGKVLAAAWVPLSAYWIALVYNTNTGQIVPYTHGMAAESLWTSVGAALTITPQHNATPNKCFVATAPDPTTAGKAWLGVVTSATSCSLYTYASGVFTSQGSLTVSTGQETVTMTPVGSQILVGIGSQTAGEAKLVAYPATTTAVIGATAAVWRIAGSPAAGYIAVPAFTTSATQMWVTTDSPPSGLSWSPVGIGFLNAGEQIFDIAYAQDAYGPCFVVGINTTGGHPRFVKAYQATGLWQQQSQTFTMQPGISLCGNDGSMIVCSTTDGNTTGFSVDGGVTWYPAYEAIVDTGGQSTSSQYQPPSLAGNGVSFVIFNSQSARLSFLEGLPMASM